MARKFVLGFLASTLVLIPALGCAVGTADEEGVEKTDEALQQGGCSMSEIHLLQSACVGACGGHSRGIDHCWPGTLTAGAPAIQPVSQGGICVC